MTIQEVHGASCTSQTELFQVELSKERECELENGVDVYGEGLSFVVVVDSELKGQRMELVSNFAKVSEEFCVSWMIEARCAPFGVVPLAQN